MVIQKRRAIDQRPDDVLGDGQAFVLELLFAERDRPAKLLQLRIDRQRLLRRRQLRFKLFQSRVFGQRLLLAGQLGLQLLVLLVVLADVRQQRISLGIGPLVGRLGEDRGDRPPASRN